MNIIKNRIDKNLRKIRPWAQRHQIEAYRIYERDIPDYPYIVDVYRDHVIIFDRSDELIDRDIRKKDHLLHLTTALQSLLGFSEDHIILKRRSRQKGEAQYKKIENRDEYMVIRESQAQFYINLYDYLDTGLFLDHRLMRQHIYKISEGRKFLNLFSYTGSVSVFAALGGATTTSVDMSATYTRWAEENFRLNQISLTGHRFVVENALDFLNTEQSGPKYDIIFLDPPTFSNSKKMEEYFEVEKDQLHIVQNCMRILSRSGTLFFSNNKRSFKLDPSIESVYSVKNITDKTLPKDFRDPKIHHVFEIQHK